MVENLLTGLWLANPRLRPGADRQKFPRCRSRPGVDLEKSPGVDAQETGTDCRKSYPDANKFAHPAEVKYRSKEANYTFPISVAVNSSDLRTVSTCRVQSLLS